MKIRSYKFRDRDIYLIPIGDVHIGDKSFNKESEEKLRGYINWVKETPNAYVFLMGDLVNCATRTSVSSPFEQNLNLGEQIKRIVNLLSPIKNKILGAIDGNHEIRLKDYTGYSPTISICDRLGINYFGNSAVVIFRLGCRRNLKSPRGSFTGYFHHTTGGGTTPGSKINRIDKLRMIVSDADFYCGAHNHALGCFHSVIFRVNQTTERVEQLRQMLIDTGGYLNYNNSYAEKGMLPPLKIGSPKIHLILKQHKGKVQKDIHVSL